MLLSNLQTTNRTFSCWHNQLPTLNMKWNCPTIFNIVISWSPLVTRITVDRIPNDTWHITHYIDVIMTTMASQITSLTVVYSTVYSDADQRKHQSSASLAFVWGIHRDRWIPRTKGQLRGKCFHLMTSSWGSETWKCIANLLPILQLCVHFIWIQYYSRLLYAFTTIEYNLPNALQYVMSNNWSNQQKTLIVTFSIRDELFCRCRYLRKLSHTPSRDFFIQSVLNAIGIVKDQSWETCFFFPGLTQQIPWVWQQRLTWFRCG